MKTLKQFLLAMDKKKKDSSIFNDRSRLNSLKPFHPAPSFWALIPVKIKTVKHPQKHQQDPDLFD
jgi:hypothetical protein